MDERIKEMLLAPFGGEGSIYKIKKYAIRKSNEKKPLFGPCFLVINNRKAAVYEILSSGKISDATDVTGSVDPEKQKKFISGPFSYKIVKKL
jgi:hypothetical protein